MPIELPVLDIGADSCKNKTQGRIVKRNPPFALQAVSARRFAQHLLDQREKSPA